MSTKLEAELAISSIVKHPKNPRHRAVADDDMVASVREHGLVQPVVVAPHPDTPATYIVIAGHRRLDASRKAKLKAVPAIIREDLATEGQQIEAMIIENGHRLDLTPIEEAEGYAQLELLGYKAPAIAAAVGRDVKTVRTRLKLLKLAPSTKKKVHAGQMSLDDATVFVEFADDPDATKRLEKVAASGHDFKYTVQQLRRHRDARSRIAAEVAKLLQRGATEITLKPGESVYGLWDYDRGPCPVTRTFSDNWDHHKTCLGFVQYDTEYSGPMLDVVCTDLASHKEQLAAEEREEVERREAEDRAAKAREEAQEISADLRTKTLLELAWGATISTGLRDLVRALLPALVVGLSGDELEAYQRAVGVIEADRWKWISDPKRDSDKPNATRLRAHLADIDEWSDAALVRAIAAVLVAAAEVNLEYTWRRWDDIAADYFALLSEAGHEFSTVDLELRNQVTGEPAKASA